MVTDIKLDELGAESAKTRNIGHQHLNTESRHRVAVKFCFYIIL